MLRFLPAISLLLLAQAAFADVKQVSPEGFMVEEAVELSASPAKAYASLIEVGRWWNPQHSYSHNAANLHLQLTEGGCFCETLPGLGWHQHMGVVDVQLNKMIRLQGALGPLQAEGVQGSLTWSIAPMGQGSVVTQSCVVGGFLRDGAAKWAPMVDGMLHEQLTRYKALVETGAPTP